ncbi:MAG: hypothetical protein AAF959_06885, partial [Cyanobacteria bacterium P01_D01_bin.56]
EVATVKEPVFDKLEDLFAELFRLSEDVGLKAYLKRQQGGLHWWQDNYAAALQSWEDFPTGQILIELAKKRVVSPEKLPENTTGSKAILAWLLPEQRRELIKQLLIKPRNDLPQFNTALPSEEQVEKFVATMEQAISFDNWLKLGAPIEQPRTRRIGFGVLNRHIDGPSPLDYSPSIVNQPITTAFPNLFTAPTFFPEFDRLLQRKRQDIMTQINI